jgi:hypothetical protein
MRGRAESLKQWSAVRYRAPNVIIGRLQEAPRQVEIEDRSARSTPSD